MTFPGDDNDGEGAIHCHGFAWAEDDADPSSRYKANNLFYVSMYDHMLQRGYVRNIPGAPMCGCIEQMPTATRSDCTQIDVEETYRITKKADGMTAKIESIDIDFNSCNGVNNRNNDLSAYFHQLHEDGKVSNDKRAALGKYLVENDNCEAATAYFLSTKGYLEGADYDSTVWYQFAIKGTETEISVDRSEFNEMLEESPNKIFRRICPLCADSHKEIYYRRKTPIATNRDILQKILNKWDNGNNNRFEEDYDLYSTYEDAKSGSNAWKFCNGSNKKGFPSECGPTGYVANQHSRFDNNSGQTNVVFLVEKASESSTDGGDESSTDISDTSPDNGDSLSLDSSDSSPDNDDESPPDSGESALNNYDFYQGKDSSGKNIRNLLNEAQGAGVEYVEYYAEWCNQRPACKGFNSNGWVKKAIRNQKKWSNTNEPDKGLYVKKV